MERIVKSLLSYACCLAGAIILNSSLLILNSSAESVVGGEVGPFVNWPGAVDADEKHTPGSAEFYKTVDAMTVYDSGVVYRNGTVVTNVPFPQVVASTDDDCDYGWCYDFTHSVGAGEHFAQADRRRKAIRMNQFDVGWTARTNLTATEEIPVRYYAYGTGATSRAISPPVMLPASRRMDNETRSSLLATCEAYFERLYWGSKGDVNDWDESKWGRKTPGPGFKFNFKVPVFADVYIECTNHFEYVYPTNDVRLLEHTNFVALAAAVRRMFPTGVCDDYYYFNEFSHPAWLFRYNWLADTCMNGMWWSSSKLPRMEDQPVGGGSGATYTPDKTDFTLLPVTEDWISDGEASDESEMRWACRSFTLDVFKAGGGFAGRPSETNFPCCHVMYLADKSVNWFGYNPPLSRTVPTWQTNDTLQDYLTNAFTHAAMESVNPMNAMGRYLAAFNNDSHRLTPSAYAGYNHVLAVMDRTITIPAFPPADYHHNLTDVTRGGTYSDGIEPTGYWSDIDGCYHVDYGSGSKTLHATGYTNSVETSSWNEMPFCQLSVTDLDRREGSVDIPRTITSPSGQVLVGHEFFSYLCAETGWDYLYIHFIPIDDSGMLTVWCEKVEDGRRTYEYAVVDVPSDYFRSEDDPYAPPLTASARRSYDFVSSDRQTPRDLLIQPPADAGERVREAVYALAKRRYVNSVTKEWKFGEECAYTRGTWASQMRSEAAAVKADLDALALAFYGVDYSQPDEFAPLPQSVTATVSGEFKYRPESYEMTSTIVYPQQHYYYKERYRGVFMVPEYFVDVTNVTACVSNVSASAEIAAFVKEEVAPDGWRWVTEAYTNEVAREILSVVATTNESVDTSVFGITNMVTKYRWGDGHYDFIEREEWTNHFAEAASETIENTAYSGTQTNLVVYYDEHLTVTNVTTNVTAISWTAATTNATARSEYVDGEHREWIDYDYLAYFAFEERDDYVFLLDKYIYDLNGMAYWVIFDPMSGEMITLEGIAYPFPIGQGFISLRLESAEPVSLTVDWPEMPTAPFEAKEAFHSIHRVDWDWKSMHFKGE